MLGSESGRSELRKPVAYSVTEQSFPASPSAAAAAAVASTTACSPLHHLDLRDVPGAKLPPYSLCARAVPGSSPGPAPGPPASLRAGRVRFLDGGHLSTHRPPDFGVQDPALDDLVVPGSTSLTTPPSSILRARCLRAAHHFAPSTVDDLTAHGPYVSPAGLVTTADTVVSDHNHE